MKETQIQGGNQDFSLGRPKYKPTINKLPTDGEIFLSVWKPLIRIVIHFEGSSYG